MLLSVLLYAVDTTVANVALPVIQGNLAITREQSSWVLTSYLIASASHFPLYQLSNLAWVLRSYRLVSWFWYRIGSLCDCAEPRALVVRVFFRVYAVPV